MRRNIDSGLLALSLLTVGESAHAFSSFMPSRFTIRNWVLCAENKAELDQNIVNLRSGYTPSLLMGLGLGGVISVLAKSPLPLLFSIATSAVMIRLYEGALPPELQMRNPFDLLKAGTSTQPPANVNPALVGSDWLTGL